MYLIELIPTETTRPDLVEFISDFAEHILGKGIVRCKDTPNFIANRVGIFSILHTIHLMLEEGYTIDEVDAITGPPMGRPRSATFRLGDIIGLDVLVDVANNVYENARNDEQREVFRVPDFIYRWLKGAGSAIKRGVASIKGAAAKAAVRSGRWTTIRLNTCPIRRYGLIRLMGSDELLTQGSG